MTRIRQHGLLISCYFLSVAITGCHPENFLPYKAKSFHNTEKLQNTYIDANTKIGFMKPNNILFLTKKGRHSLYKSRIYRILTEIKLYLLPIYAGKKTSSENLPEYIFVFKCSNIDSVKNKLAGSFQSITQYLFNTEHNFYTDVSKKAFFYYTRKQDQVYTFIVTQDKISSSNFLIVYAGEFKDPALFLNYMERWDLDKTDSNFKYTTAQIKYGIDTVLQIHAFNSIYNIARTITNEIDFLQSDFYRIADSLFRDTEGANYLKPIASLLRYKNEVEKNEINYLKRNEYYQCLATYYSFIGNNKAALNEESNLKIINQELQLTGSYQVMNAREELFKNVAGKKIIAFNEAHHDVRCRAFVLSVLDSLKKTGFTHLAIEDFNKEIRSKEINSQSGFYLREPLLNNLISHAQKIGFKLISYDYKKIKKGNADNRDKSAARALLRKINFNKGDRLIIYCGYGHTDKFTSSEKTGSLVQNIWHTTQTEPYTINLAFPRLYHITDSSIRQYYVIKGDAIDKYYLKFINGDLKVFPPNVLSWFDYDQYYNDGLIPFIQKKYQFNSVDTILKDAIFSFLIYKHTGKNSFELDLPVFTKALKNESLSFNYYIPEPAIYDIFIRDQQGKIIKHEMVNIENSQFK